jgi:hypothetical protein
VIKNWLNSAVKKNKKWKALRLRRFEPPSGSGWYKGNLRARGDIRHIPSSSADIQYMSGLPYGDILIIERNFVFIEHSIGIAIGQIWNHSKIYIWKIIWKYDIFLHFHITFADKYITFTSKNNLSKKAWHKYSYKGEVGRVSRDAAWSEKCKCTFSRNLYINVETFNYGNIFYLKIKNAIKKKA